MKKKNIIIILSILILTASCNDKIEDLREDSRNYIGEQVTLKGEVVGSMNLFFIKYYEIKDNTGTMWVKAKGSVPMEGNIVTVKGTLEQSFKLGEDESLVIIEGD